MAVPRLRSACDTCHQMKTRCSGTLPCDNCAESGQACLYSVSNRVGRPPGAKNKRSIPTLQNVPGPATNSAHSRSRSIPMHTRSPTMRITPQQHRASVSAGSASDEAAIGQHAWELDHPTFPQRQHSDSRIQRLSHQQTLTPPETAMSGDTSQVNSHEYAFSRPSQRKRRREDAESYEFSAMVGGSWNWGLPVDSLPQESTRLDNSTHCEFVESLQLPDLHVFNNLSSATMMGQPPQAVGGATQIAASSSENSYAGQSDVNTLRHPQRSDDCSCVENHTRLLCMLKRGGPAKASKTTADKCHIMAEVNEAMKTWKELIECRSCAHDENPDVLLLALMCGREVLTRISAESGLFEDGSGAGPHTNTNAAFGGMSTSSPSLNIDGFEVMGDDKTMLLQALRSITLRKIETVIACLREVLERKKRLQRESGGRAGADGSPPRGNSAADASCLTYLDHMLQNITSLLKTLQCT